MGLGQHISITIVVVTTTANANGTAAATKCGWVRNKSLSLNKLSQSVTMWGLICS